MRIAAVGAVLIAAAALAFWLSRGTDPLDPEPAPQAAQNPPPDAARMPAAQPSPAASPATARAQAAPIAPDEEGLDAFLRARHAGPWVRQRFDGQPVHRTSIHGGLVAGAGKDAESAHSLGRTISRYLGVDPSQLDPSPSRTDSGPRSLTYEFRQMSQGFEVFDGRMTLLARKDDGAVYLVNSDLRVPDAVETQPRVTFDEAEKVVEEKYSGREASVSRTGSVPVIWADSKPHELAWRFSVEIPAPNPDRLEVLVGASSGRIVLERSTLMH